MLDAPGLEVVLEPLINDLRAVLGNDLIGLYLYGSAVSGGFEAGVSDIDLVAVTRIAVTRLHLRALAGVHRRVLERDPSWTNRLELAYVAASTVGESIGNDPVAVISPGEPFHITGPASEWLMNWYLVRETSIALVGPPATRLLAPISEGAFLAAVRAYVEYVRTVKSPGYAVLSACRGLRTLETGEPCSKQEGAKWAKERMPEWAWLIDRAVADRRSRGGGFEDEAGRSAARRFVDLIAARVASAGAP